jgi:septum formation protein
MSDLPRSFYPAHLSPFLDWPAGLVLILASRSPRRADLLGVAGIPFEIITAGDVEEELAASLADLHRDPGAYAVTLAEAKARDVAARHPDRLVLGADTVVVLDGDILEKPRDTEDAVRLLTRLSGQKHTVISAVALVGGAAGSEAVVGYEETGVEFLPLTRPAIERYVATGEPMDKAGAYGIQGYGALMVRGVEGCYFNVMGLPLARLGDLLKGVLA